MNLKCLLKGAIAGILMIIGVRLYVMTSGSCNTNFWGGCFVSWACLVLSIKTK